MNLSFWCVMIAAALPYVPFGFVRGLDPKNPRLGAKTLSGLPARAHAAHLNAFEAFPPFAAAVIISYLSLGVNFWTNVLAVLFLVARFAHVGFYLADVQPARSAAWTLGIVIVIAMFVHAGL